ncbi:uncharacterized protein LOC108733496 isoform X2 [Agrilus planipennis]|nr:uncharacterized protein LOC108733496 isoform X2 [Agrilus planipennis]
MALSGDGVKFEKFSRNPIIPFPPEDGGSAFRDPKVWKHEDNWYLLMGNQAKENGRVVLYESKDLKNWNYIGVLASSWNGSLGYMWECPDFFKLNESYVLIFSPQGLERDGDKYANLYQTGYVVGGYCYEYNHFSYGHFTEMDFGHDFYAMQTMETPDKRRVGVAWMGMWESNFPESEEGWAGALTIPRELYLEEGKLIQKPIRETKLLRKSLLFSKLITVNGMEEICELKAAEIDIDTKLCADIDEFGFVLDDQEGLVVKFYLNETDKTFNLDRGDEDPRKTGFEELLYLKMQIFLDASSLEVFLNDGEITFTSRIYPNQSPLLSIFSRGSCALDVDVKIFELENIWEKCN